MHPADPPPDPTGYYHRGATTVFAYAGDQRFSYCLYLPERDGDAGALPLVVLVHGTERGNAAYRDAFAPFAERYGCAVLAPNFEKHGITVHFDLVAGVAHNGSGVRDAVKGFFADVLTGAVSAP